MTENVQMTGLGLNILITIYQWRRQTRGVRCVRTPCHEDA